MKRPPVDSAHPPGNVARPERLEPVALAVILALAIVLRLWAIGFGFPERTRPDEQYFVDATQRFDRLGTLDPQWYFYPAFYMYTNLVVWRTYTLCEFFRGNYEVPDARRRQPSTHGIDQIRARSPDMEFLLGRLVTACFGIATVLVTYALGRRFYGRKAAAAAAFLLAVNGLHTLNSHFYKSDVATTFFTVTALWCMGSYVCERRVAWNLGAAVCTGLAASTNYYGGFLLLPLVVSQFLAHGTGRRPGGRGNSSPEDREPDWLAALGRVALDTVRTVGRTLVCWETYAIPAIALATFVATSPYCFLRWTEFLNTFHRMLFSDRQSLYDTLVRQIQFDDYGFQSGPWAYSLRFCHRYSMGMVLGLVSACGLVFLVIRRRAVGSVLLVFVAIHFLMMASGKAVFMRYYLSLVPFLALAAGVLLSWVIQRIAPGRPARQNLALAAALVVVGAEGFWSSVQQDRLLAREDTRVEARRWLAANLPPGAVVGTPVDWWGKFYPYGKPTLPPHSRYEAVRPEEVRAKSVRYLVVDDAPLRLYSPADRPDWPSWLERNAQLRHEISPHDPGAGPIRPVYDQLDAFYLPVARFSGIRRPGPRIRIYAVRDDR